MQNYRANKLAFSDMKKTGNECDHVFLSEKTLKFSKTLNELKSKVLDEISSEQERKNDIKDRIKRGEYNISSELVAERILLRFQN